MKLGAILSLAIFLLQASTALASQAVQLKMNLELNGKKSSPIIVTNFDQEAKISSHDDGGNGYEISIMPKHVKNDDPEAKPAVELSMKIFEVVNHKSKLVSSPKVISLLGEEASLEQMSGDNKVRLSIVTTSL